MIQKIYIETTKGKDLHAENLMAEIVSKRLNNKISKIKSFDVYWIEGISKKEAKILADHLLCEKINQRYSLTSPVSRAKKIEIGYKKGVMNPKVASIKKAARDLGIKPTEVNTSVLYHLYTSLKKDLGKILARTNAYNPLIEEVIEEEPKTLIQTSAVGMTNKIPIKSMSDEELKNLSRDTLFLSLDEMKEIKKFFIKQRRDPTDCELEIIAQTWSEHCIHKTFKSNLVINGKRKKSFFSRIKSTAKYKKNIVSAFVDNSGVTDFYDGFSICGKVETHNSPSAIEPYGGAMTGSGGVFRDILGTGKGAKPIVSTDIFCLGPYDLDEKLVPPGCLHPRYTLKKVIEGVRDYGNRVGIPTNNGSLHFNEGFRAKPTVAVGAYGIIPTKRALKSVLKKGDLILTLGGKTGRDGIHGATFSSASMTDKTKSTLNTAVQIGNAIEEKRLIDCILTLSDQNLITSITDCGAGGYSSAIGEMAKDNGANVYLDQVPLKYSGLSPWEIFLSESQERMIIAIKPDFLAKILKVAKRHNVEASVIGEITDSLSLRVFYKTETVADLSMNFLHNGVPLKTLVGKSFKNKKLRTTKTFKLNDIENVWKNVLAHPNVASKEPILRIYDHNVKGTNALHPFSGVYFDGPNDASIVRPLLNKPYGLIVAHGLNPSMMEHDPYWGSIWAITEAVSNYVSVGGDLENAALIDNFIWPTPDPESLYDLDQSIDACIKMSEILKMPFVSGKDSLSSTYRFPDGKILKIPPVLLISVFGKIPDVEKTVSQDFKRINSKIILLGKLDYKNMAGSVYAENTKTNYKNVPHVDLVNFGKVLSKITKSINTGSILSCHDISEGGLTVALSEMCFGGDMGAVVDLKKIANQNQKEILFNETAGTFLVEISDKETPEKLFKGIPFFEIGRTTLEKKIAINFGKKTVAYSYLETLKKAWQKPFKKIFA